MSKIIYKACRWTEKGMNKKKEVGFKISTAIWLGRLSWQVEIKSLPILKGELWKMKWSLKSILRSEKKEEGGVEDIMGYLTGPSFLTSRD